MVLWNVDSFYRKKSSENIVHKVPSTSFPLPSCFLGGGDSNTPSNAPCVDPSQHEGLEHVQRWEWN